MIHCPLIPKEKKHMKTDRTAIEKFFSAKAFAVVGVSGNRKKFGNMAFRAMTDRGMVVYPVNPHRMKVEGVKCYSSVLELPETVTSIVTMIHPAATEQMISDCIPKKIDVVWMQSGSESKNAIDEAVANGITVISGQCIMMFLEPVVSAHAVHRWFNKIVGAYPR